MAVNNYRFLVSLSSFLIIGGSVAFVTIKVDNGEKGGTWGPTILCPEFHRAVGFATQNDKRIDVPLTDKSGLNGIALYCDDVDRTNITSLVGEDGDFGRSQDCASGFYMTSFHLRVLPSENVVYYPALPNITLPQDNTAANDIEFKCSNDRTINVAYGNNDGAWGNWSETCEFGICGIQTRVEPTRPIIDNTAVNDITFRCCDA